MPVVDLDRADGFYAAVLAIKVSKESFDGFSFAVLEHDQGNGGCLVPNAGEVSSTQGILVYSTSTGASAMRLRRSNDMAAA